MNQMPWIERTFPIDTPLQLFPGILERLRGTPARLEDRIAILPPDLLTQRLDDKWSILENAGHLIGVGVLWRGRLDDFAAGLEILRPADMSNRKTFEADYNLKPMPDVLAEFRAQRAILISRLEDLDTPSKERVAKHPRLNQPMRILDMMVFAAEHDDHHLARITEILRILRKRARG